jgi:hypothetical protein
MYIEMVTALGKFVDMSDICNFKRRHIVNICWSNLHKRKSRAEIRIEGGHVDAM